MFRGARRSSRALLRAPGLEAGAADLRSRIEPVCSVPADRARAGPSAAFAVSGFARPGMLALGLASLATSRR